MAFMKREELVAQVRDRLLGKSYPHLTTAIILIASGGLAFLFSAIALSAGITEARAKLVTKSL